MPTWDVMLNGDVDDLTVLVSLGVGVTQEGEGRFVLRSPELDALTDVRAVRERAVERVAVFSGLSRIAEGDAKARAVVVGAIFRDDGTRRDVFVTPDTIEIRLGGRAPALGVSGNAAATPAANPYATWDAAAERDPNVKLALRFFGPAPTSENLWKVYEVIRDDVGDKANIIGKGWATDDQIDSFRSVHYPSALGEKARHGIEPTRRPAPRDPMSLAEAREFIRRLLVHWLSSK